jgi:hypothetical protein
MSPHNPFTNSMYDPPRAAYGMSNTQKITEMCSRVGLPQRLGMEIYYMAMNAALRLGRPRADMVLVAKAIKYASENKHRLQPKWRS